MQAAARTALSTQTQMITCKAKPEREKRSDRDDIHYSTWFMANPPYCEGRGPGEFQFVLQCVRAGSNGDAHSKVGRKIG